MMLMQSRSISQLADFAGRAQQYATLRAQHPDVPARVVKAYIGDDQGLSLEQFACGFLIGHRWSHTGTAYGGDDESYHGEGRSYCQHCGMDGDG